MSRSPIARLIDKACGVTDADLKKPTHGRLRTKRQIDHDAEVLLALADQSIRWWEQKRPDGWTEEQHLKNPTVNCVTAEECKLAKSVRKWIKLGG